MVDNNYNDQILKMAEEFNYSPFMIKALQTNYPDDYLKVIKAFEKPPYETIRVNSLKTTPKDLEGFLKRKKIYMRPTNVLDYAFNIDCSQSKIKPGATHEYLQGFYYLQSLASMVPVHFLAPQPGETVLDMCAAPGSKTTQIGQFMNQQGLIVAVDVKTSKIQALTSNIKRCGILNCIVFPYDSTQLKSRMPLNFKPDRILLDAPCTGSGILRNDPTQKKVKNNHHLKQITQTQKQLLRTGLDLLKPGGYLMYSTCSFHYQENELVISEVLAKTKNVSIEEPYELIGLPGHIEIDGIELNPELIKSRRLNPAINDTDAFFYCLLHKEKI